MSQQQHLIKVILLGDAGVGKTALFSKYLARDVQPDYPPTIGVDFGHRHLQTGSDQPPVKIQLWDTAGQERFRSITRSYYRGAHIILLLFDLMNAESFSSLKGWVEDVRHSVSHTSSPRFFVVGTKADEAVTKRAVTVEKARAFATDLDAPYFEVSAHDGGSLETMFEAIVPLVVPTLRPLVPVPLEVHVNNEPQRGGWRWC